MVIIEMNPRVSRSSALASKATGFPIAKAAARLAVGYTLDEIVNDMTGTTPACFEPSIDYCVVKAPRFAFEKFQGADDTLTTRMKAVGEVMAVRAHFRGIPRQGPALPGDGTGLVSGPTGRAKRRRFPTRSSSPRSRAPRPSASSWRPRPCAGA